MTHCVFRWHLVVDQRVDIGDPALAKKTTLDPVHLLKNTSGRVVHTWCLVPNERQHVRRVELHKSPRAEETGGGQDSLRLPLARTHTLNHSILHARTTFEQHTKELGSIALELPGAQNMFALFVGVGHDAVGTTHSCRDAWLLSMCSRSTSEGTVAGKGVQALRSSAYTISLKP